MYVYVCMLGERGCFFSFLFFFFFLIFAKIYLFLSHKMWTDCMTVVIIYAQLCSWKGFKIDLRRPFFSFKTFSTYGGVQLYAQDFQKSPSSDLIWRGRPLVTSSLPWPHRGQKSSLRSLRNSWSRLVASLIFFPWCIIKEISEFSELRKKANECKI